MARGFEFDQATSTFKDIPDEQPNNSAASFWERPKPEDLEQAPPPPPEEPKKPEPKRKCTRFLSNGDPQSPKEETTKPKKSDCPLTSEQKKTKPLNSKDPDKWYNEGGTISIDKNNIWTYRDKEGNVVKYTDGYPDFKTAELVKQEVNIGKFEGYQKDFPKADRLAPNGKKAESSTWHHHQDGETMQEVNKKVHARFTHRGGMSIKKKSEKELCEIEN